MKIMRNKKGQIAGIGMSVFAVIIGAVWRFAGRFLPGGEIIKLVSGLTVAVTILLLAFGAIFSGVGLAMITSNVILNFIFLLGLGYAAASLIADLFGL